MSESNANFAGTKLAAENGEEMEPPIAGISPPGVPTMEGDAAAAAVGAHLDDDDAGEAEMTTLDEENNEADVTASGAE